MADLTGMMQAAAGGAGGGANYIEGVFSTYLYTGNNGVQTIVNDIDLAGEGGLIWFKRRNAATDNTLYDTARGINFSLSSNLTDANINKTGDFSSFNSDGFTIGVPTVSNDIQSNAGQFVSWTFRKQPKFFDVVTWTGTGSNRTIAHSLGSVPGCIIVKRTDTTAAWAVYHRSLANTQYLVLNSVAAAATGATWWNSTTPTDAVFSLGTDATVNASGGTYVAYVLAHDAGGFGLEGTDNVISCGAYTGNGTFAGLDVDLGYEAQFVIVKRTTASDAGANWVVVDTMRGMNQQGVAEGARNLLANTTADESAQGYLATNSKGFHVNSDSAAVNQSGETFIYIAIRRGPMAVPELGTTVFSPIASSASVDTQLTTNFPVDLQMYGIRAGDAANITTSDRLRGVSTTNIASGQFIVTSSTAAETNGTYTRQWGNTGFVMPAGIGGTSGIFWNFGRAPGFFDEVCYTGTGTNRTVAHNLGVAPELMIVKKRSSTAGWAVYAAPLSATNAVFLNLTNATSAISSIWNDTAPTSSVFTVGVAGTTNDVSQTLVAYLFATCPGVSKVGSYTGTGTTLAINCGFTTGARFVLIKRTDDTGDWYVWDSARGIIAGNDPYLLINSSAAEVTGTDYVDTASTGFEISSTAPAAINASGGSYIFWAVA
jgi:hypothetical protein